MGAGGRTASVTVIVPTFNEAPNLAELVERICASLPAVEILFVDDASGDGTPQVVRELANTFPVRLIERVDERGLSTAVLRGLKEARTEICVVMDADLSHSPESIPRMVRAVQDGADVAIGSRYVRGGEIDQWPFFRRLASRLGTTLARPLTPVRDPMAGFFCLRRNLLEGIPLKPRGFKILLEILARTGTRNTVEVPIRFGDRSKGASKFGHRERREYMAQIRELYLDLNPWPLKVAKFICAGAIGILPNLAVLNLVIRLGGSREVAVVMGWLMSMTSNYVLNREWTFRAGSQPVLSTYLKYAIGALAGLGINVAVVGALPTWNINLCVLLGIAAGTIFNFLMSQAWVFPRK